MAGWQPKRNPWFSPRAITAPVSRGVVAVQTGPNTWRYESEKTTLNRGNLDQGTLYSDYRKTKSERKKERRNKRYGWDADEEDYYGETLSVVQKKPAYAWESTRWSNWSYTSYVYADDDSNDNLFVKEPENYLTPTKEQIAAKTNYWASEDIKRIKELARVCYFKMIDDKDYIAEKFKDRNDYGGGTEEWDKKVAMFENVYETFIPGFTPLEQAIAFNHKVRDVDSYNNRQKKSGREKSRRIEFRRCDYADPDLNTQVDMCRFNKDHKLAILDKISIIGDLGSQFKVEKGIGEQEVANSDIHRKKIMRSYDQLRMIDTVQRMLPTFRRKFLTKDLLINVPVQTSEKKQKIIILCDQSGSMNETDKQIWVNALLMDRFKYVIRGEAEVFFSFFVSNTSSLKFIHVKDAKDVERFWTQHSNYPSGSFTNIGRVVEHVAASIKSGKLHNLDVDLSKELPEILIINDGQDEVGYDEFPYKVNAISLMQMSDELKDLCIATGGKQVEVTGHDQIYTYSTSGKDTIAE